VSKNWDLLQIGRHRPLVNTGRLDGQLEHWLKEAPEQLAQSGWQVRHEPDVANVLEGQVETHFPFEASWLAAHVKQNVDEPAQVPQEESHAIFCNKYTWHHPEDGETHVYRSSCLEGRGTCPMGNSQYMSRLKGQNLADNQCTEVD